MANSIEFELFMSSLMYVNIIICIQSTAKTLFCFSKKEKKAPFSKTAEKDYYLMIAAKCNDFIISSLTTRKWNVCVFASLLLLFESTQFSCKLTQRIFCCWCFLIARTLSYFCVVFLTWIMRNRSHFFTHKSLFWVVCYSSIFIWS